MRTPSGGALLRRINAVAVLKALHAADTLTLRQLAEQANVARNTAEEAAEGLARIGLTSEVAPGDEHGRPIGRPPKRYRFRPDYGYAMGVDFSVHEVVVLLTDLWGETTHRVRVELATGISLRDRLDVARHALLHAVESAGLTTDDVLCVGVATTGIIDTEGRVLRSFRLPELEEIDLAQALAVVGDAPVVVGNDTRLATLAEHWRGAGAGTDDFVNVIAGRVLHAGIFLGGRLLYGSHGAAGEIAYLPGAGWDAAHQALSTWPGAREDTFAAAAAGDADAIARVDEFARELATGIAALALVVDPDRIVIGGGLSEAGEGLLTPLREHLDRLTLFPVPLVTSTLTHDAVALGAARLALDRIEGRLFDPESPALAGIFEPPSDGVQGADGSGR